MSSALMISCFGLFHPLLLQKYDMLTWKRRKLLHGAARKTLNNRETFHCSGEEMLYIELNLGVILLNVRHGFVYGPTWVSHIKISCNYTIIICTSRRMWFKWVYAMFLPDTWSRVATQFHGPHRSKNNATSETFLAPKHPINIYDFQHHNFHILICKLSSWINGHNGDVRIKLRCY